MFRIFIEVYVSNKLFERKLSQLLAISHPLTRSVVLKVDKIAPSGVILMGRGAKKQREQ